jgi:hypothetical protein
VAFGISVYLVLHPATVYALRNTPIRPLDFYRSISRPALASLVMVLAGLVVTRLLSGAHDLTVLAISFPVCALTYLAAHRLVPGGKEATAEYVGYAWLVLSKRKVSPIPLQ